MAYRTRSLGLSCPSAAAKIESECMRQFKRNPAGEVMRANHDMQFYLGRRVLCLLGSMHLSTYA